jgi:hypothetical protein
MSTTAELVNYLRSEADDFDDKHSEFLLGAVALIESQAEQLEQVKAATEGCEQSNCPCCTKIDAILKVKS